MNIVMEVWVTIYFILKLNIWNQNSDSRLISQLCLVNDSIGLFNPPVPQLKSLKMKNKNTTLSEKLQHP